jgi:hypothetical protein
MFPLIAIAAVWIFFTFGIYSLYVTYVVPHTFSLMGFSFSGIIGGFLALWMAGYNYMQLIFTHVLALTGSTSEYLFVGGFVACLCVFVWNSIVTHGQAILQ